MTTRRIPDGNVGVNRVLRALGTGLLLLGALLCAGTSRAADALPLDVVLVLDSSGSMKKTDPRELRKPAAKLLLALLGKEDRAAVVSFSDQGYPIAYLTAVKGVAKARKAEPEGSEGAGERRLFGAVDRISSRGLYTNLHGAVEAAQTVLARDSVPGRRQIIVLMSDGRMDLGNAQVSAEQTEKLRAQLLPALKEKGVVLYTLAFTEQSDVKLLQEMAQATGGRFNMAQSDKELHEAFAAIFEQNKTPDMLPFHGEQFHIDDAVEEVTIIGSKDSAEVVLSLISPAGTAITAENKPKGMKWLVSPLFDLITMRRPERGDWKLQASNGRNRAYVITDLQLRMEVAPPSPESETPVAVRAWLEERGKTVTQEAIVSGLRMVLDVLPSAAEAQGSVLAPQIDQGVPSGVYVTETRFASAGRQELRVTAVGGTFARERSLVLDVPASAGKAAASATPALAAHPPEPAAPKEKHKVDEKPSHKKSEPKATTASGWAAGIAIFLLMNAVIAGGIGVFVYLRRKRARGAASSEAGEGG